MFEHVGPKNYDTYFEVVDRNLKPDGIFLLHTIGSKRTDNNVDPWINKYIFPNGCLPSIRQIANASESHFIMEDWHNFGADYDTTLMAWHERFQQAWPEIADNYSERFKRMFSYYLNACAGAFRARDIQLWQVVFSRGIEHGLRVPRKNNPGYPGLFLFFFGGLYYGRLFRRQHTLDGIYDRPGLRIDFDIHTLPQFFAPSVVRCSVSGIKCTQKRVGVTSPTVRLIPSIPINPLYRMYFINDGSCTLNQI